MINSHLLVCQWPSAYLTSAIILYVHLPSFICRNLPSLHRKHPLYNKYVLYARNKTKSNISLIAEFACKTTKPPLILPFSYYHKTLNCSKFVVTRFPWSCGYNPNKKIMVLIYTMIFFQSYIILILFSQYQFIKICFNPNG